jgi:hypothetical protein
MTLQVRPPGIGGEAGGPDHAIAYPGTPYGLTTVTGVNAPEVRELPRVQCSTKEQVNEAASFRDRTDMEALRVL